MAVFPPRFCHRSNQDIGDRDRRCLLIFGVHVEICSPCWHLKYRILQWLLCKGLALSQWRNTEAFCGQPASSETYLHRAEHAAVCPSCVLQHTYLPTIGVLSRASAANLLVRPPLLPTLRPIWNHWHCDKIVWYQFCTKQFCFTPGICFHTIQVLKWLCNGMNTFKCVKKVLYGLNHILCETWTGFLHCNLKQVPHGVNYPCFSERWC
jgi:hypothetical protein